MLSQKNQAADTWTLLQLSKFRIDYFIPQFIPLLVSFACKV